MYPVLPPPEPRIPAYRHWLACLDAVEIGIGLDEVVVNFGELAAEIETLRIGVDDAKGAEAFMFFQVHGRGG